MSASTTSARSIEAGLATINGNLARRVRSGKLSEADRDAALSRIKAVPSYEGFGDYDLVIIADVPGNEAMSAIALAIAAGGAIKSSKTTVLMTGSEILGALKKATAVAKGYKPAR